MFSYDVRVNHAVNTVKTFLDKRNISTKPNQKVGNITADTEY